MRFEHARGACNQTGGANSKPAGPLLIQFGMSIAAGTRIGHVHLKVGDLERALRFYCGVLGFELTQRMGPPASPGLAGWGGERMGHSAAFISAGGYHHHIGLNTWESANGQPPAPGTTGLYHLAILYPTRADLADALRRVVEAGIPLDGAADHGVSEALYLRDPDQNGVELYRDRPEAEWPRNRDGSLAMYTRPLDVRKLLAEAHEAHLARGQRADEISTGPKDL